MSPLDRLRALRRRAPAAAAAAPPATSWCVIDPGNQWFAAPVGTAATIGRRAVDGATIRRAAQVLSAVADDPYKQFLSRFYELGLERCGPSWHYADINTVLIAAAMLVGPTTYLEIGVRTGRSAAMLSSIAPDCSIVGFDSWIPNYAGMPNPGPEWVTRRLREAGHRGAIELVTGDSRSTVPTYLADRPNAFFDIVTVDGDHTQEGARADLVSVIERVKLGGALVFDDVSNPAHPSLIDVWRDVVERDARFSSWTFTEIGFGVACAVRMR